MRDEDPTFSVVIPTWNRSVFLRECLESVLTQTRAAHEVIVCDDGSTDDTMAVLSGYGDRVRVVQTQRRGPGGARNAGARLATGRYLSFLDSDDVWRPELLEAVAAVIREQRCRMVWVNGESSEARPEFGALDALKVRVGTGSFDMGGEYSGTAGWAAMEAALFQELGGFVEEMPVGEDLELLCRMWNLGPVAHVVEPKLYWYRVHASQSISSTRRRQLRDCGRLIFERWWAGQYGGRSMPKGYARQLLNWISWKMTVERGDGWAERWIVGRFTLSAFLLGALPLSGAVRNLGKIVVRW